MNTIFIVLPILTLLMFDLGLALRPNDFKLILLRPLPVCVGLCGQILLLPVIAWCVAKGFNLAPIFVIGTMLIACCPGGSSSNVFSMLAGGDVALSVTLTAFSSIITLFTMPPIMALVTANAGLGMNITLPVGNLLLQNLLLMALPIAIGLALALWKENLANRLHAILRKSAFPLLIVLATVFFIQHRDTIISEFPSIGLAMTILILATMAGGALLSLLARLNGKERKTIVIEVGMQNAAQAIALACSPLVFNNELIAIPAIIYALMMNILLLGYIGIARKKES